MTVEERLLQFRALVNERLATLLPPPELAPTELHQAMRYSALAPGKRIRPSLCLATAMACGLESVEEALDAACALELVHCFSLIHDDLPAIDNDDLRRGRPTCHIVYGEAMAILAGDALFALAFLSAVQSHSDPRVGARLCQILAAASGSEGLVGGEVMDILSEGKPGNLELLQTIHARKTGSLIEASCAFGAVVAGAPDEVVAIAQDFGRWTGIAFQIHDDILNETSTAETLGKAVGSDKERNKLTYPALVGLERANQMAQEATGSALAALEKMPGEQETLRELCLYAVQRST